jgi:hypothetical protein
VSQVVPHTWIAGDDALSSYLQTLTDALLQLQGSTPSTGQPLDVFEGYTSVAQNTTSPTATAIGMDVEVDDLASGHSTVTNTSRYTGKNPGRYLVVIGFIWAFNTTGRRIGELKLNGTGVAGPGKSVTAYPDQVGSTSLSLSTVQRMNGTTDYIEAYATQSSGGTLGVQVRMAVQYLGA